MDFSELVGAVDFSGVSVALFAIAISVAGVFAIQWGVNRVLALVDGGVPHAEAFYSGGEQRTALDSVYERAAAMAAAGEGQSDDFGHNTITAAYDAGYSGRHLGDSVDPATVRAWEDGRDARREDEIRYGDR